MICDVPVPEHVKSPLTNNAQYTKLTNWERFVKYGFSVRKLPIVINSLPKSVATALRITKRESAIRPVVERDEKGMALGSRLNPETIVSLLEKRKNATMWQHRVASLMVTLLRSPLHTRWGSISTPLFLQNRRQCLLTALAGYLLLNATGKEKSLFEGTDSTALKDMSEGAKRAMRVL